MGYYKAVGWLPQLEAKTLQLKTWHTWIIRQRSHSGNNWGIALLLVHFYSAKGDKWTAGREYATHGLTQCQMLPGIIPAYQGRYVQWCNSVTTVITIANFLLIVSGACFSGGTHSCHCKSDQKLMVRKLLMSVATWVS